MIPLALLGKDPRVIPPLLRRRLPELAIGLLCAGVVVAGTLQAVRSDEHDAPTAAPTPTATPTPSPSPTPTPTPSPTPAPRPTTPAGIYTALATFTAQERGLSFREPVLPSYLTPQAFDARAIRIGRAPARSVRKDGAYNARVSTLFDLRLLRKRPEADAYYAAAGKNTRLRVAYDPGTGRLLVRGSRLTPFVQQSIVAELTRVLQSQRLPHRPATDPEAGRAYQALSDGDAARVARAWYEAQPAAVRSAVDREASLFYGDVEGSPDALSIYDSYPALAGPLMVAKLLALGGQQRLDAAFRTPPTTTAQVRDPRLTAPPAVGAPALPRGARRLEVGVLGELGLAIMLQEYPIAPSAAKGWRGDRYLTYAVGRHTCTLLYVRTSSRAQQAALVAAGRRIVSAVRPVRSTSVAMRGCR